jgi:hypothetical protein
MGSWRRRARVGVVAGASFVLLVLVLPQIATGIGLGALASGVTSAPCGSSGSSGGSSGSGSGSSTCTPPSLTASPSTQLVDGQQITVSGASYTPDALVGIVECRASATGPQDCDLSTLLETFADGSGSFTVTYGVSRILRLTTAGKPLGTENYDCAVKSCVIGAADVSNFSVAAKTPPLTFKPHSPLALRGTLAATDLVTPKTGVADVSGTVTCTQPGTESLYVELQQIYRRFNFTNEVYTTVNCTHHATWTVQVPPGIGLFGVGSATVTAEIQGQIGNSYRTIYLKRSVMLVKPVKKTS